MGLTGRLQLTIHSGDDIRAVAMAIGVQHQRIYRIDPNCDYGSLASLVSRADQTIDTEQIA